MSSITTHSHKEETTKDKHRFDHSEQWENNIEIGGADPECKEEDKNWCELYYYCYLFFLKKCLHIILYIHTHSSWKELGNEQYEEINAPDEILPILAPEDTTPIEEIYNIKK